LSRILLGVSQPERLLLARSGHVHLPTKRQLLTLSRHRRDSVSNFAVSELNWRPGLSLLSYKCPCAILPALRQFPQELHLGTDRAERVGIEVEDAQRVIRQLFIDHFEIEIDIGGKTPRILRGHDRATRALENTAIRVAANNDTLERINRSLPSGACWLSGAEEVARGGREKFDGYTMNTRCTG
jgi:hypothetical protein